MIRDLLPVNCYFNSVQQAGRGSPVIWVAELELEADDAAALVTFRNPRPWMVSLSSMLSVPVWVKLSGD